MESMINAAMDYNTGKFSISMLSEKYGISKGKMYYMLRDAGCVFTRKKRKEPSPDEWEHRSKAQKGKTISELTNEIKQQVALNVRDPYVRVDMVNFSAIFPTST